MKKLSRLFITLFMIIALAIGGWWAVGVWSPPAMAATTNFSPSSTGVYVIPVHLSGAYAASTTAAARFDVPFKSTLVSVQASARFSTGTNETLTIDVQENGTSVLSTNISATAGSVKFGTISDATLADEAEITVDLTLGGTSPSWSDILILFTLLRR